MAFSRDSNRFCALGGVNDFRLVIWNVASLSNPDLLCSISLPLSCSKVFFDPSNSDFIALLSSDGSKVLVYRIVKSLDKFDADLTTIELPEGSPSITSVVWSRSGGLLLGDASGNLHTFDSKTAALLASLPPASEANGSAVVHIVLSHGYFIVAHKDGIVLWYKKSDDGIAPAPEHLQFASLDEGEKSILTMFESADYNHIVVITDNNNVYETQMDVDEVIPKTEGAVGAEGGMPLGMVETEPEEDLGPEEVDFSSLSSHHAGPVTAMTSCILAGKSFRSTLVTGGTGGTIKIWKDTENPILMANITTPSNAAVTSLQAITGYPVFAAGFSDGVVRIFHLSGRSGTSEDAVDIKVTTLFRVKLVDAAVTCMAFNKQNKQLAVGCYSGCNGFILNVDPAKSFSVLGTFRSGNVSKGEEEPLAALLWQPSGQLLIGSNSGFLSCVDASNLKSTSDFSEEMPIEWGCKMAGVKSLLGLKQSSKIGNGRFFYAVNTSLKGIECFAVPDGMFNESDPVISAVSMAESGAKGNVSLEVSDSGGMLASGGGGGAVSIYKVKDGSAETVSSLHVHVGPVLSVCFSGDSSRVYSSGADGSIFVLSIVNGSSFDPTLSTTDFDFKATEMSTINVEADTNEEETWISKMRKALQVKQEADSKAAKNQALAGIKNLAERLKSMLAHNESAPDIEKMARDEFVIDVKGKEDFEAANSAAVEVETKRIKSEDTAKDMIASRIRKDCWDSMQIHACDIIALQSKINKVANFPVRKMSSKETRQFELVRRMRLTEINDIKKATGSKETCWDGLTNEVPATIKWMVNTGILKPSSSTEEIVAQFKSFEEEEKKEEDVDAGDDDDFAEVVELSENSPISTFLYHPVAVRTDSQRKTQIILIKELVRQISIDFNKRFDKLKSVKEDTLGILEGKNERIREILTELKSDEEYFDPTVAKSEIVDSVLVLDDSELTTTIYESIAAREARLKKEEEARIAAEKNKGDDIPTRALTDMMNNTLEVKKEVITEDSLKREEWMDEIPFEDMTEDQRKALDEYNNHAKIIAEALEKQRKALELELKKLKSEVSEIVKSFDDKVTSLGDLRSAVLVMIDTQELYSLRLGLTVMRKEDCIAAISEAEEKIAGLHVQKDILQAHLSAFIDKKEAEEATHAALQSEIVAKEKNFRKEIQDVSSTPLDQDQVKILAGLYKSKTRSGNGDGGSGTTSYGGNRGSGGISGSRQSIGRRSSVGRRSSAGGRRSVSSRSRRSFGSTDDSADLGPLQAAMKEAQEMAAQGMWTSNKDPFLAADEARAKALLYSEVQVSNYQPLNVDDLPDTFRVSDQVWHKLNELRKARSLKENEVAVQFGKVKEAIAQMDRSKDMLSAVEKSIDLISDSLDELIEGEAADKKNIELLTVFKQGQDEVEQGAMATDYTKSLLIPMSIIKDTNREIHVHGDEKIKVLNKTKTFRKKINFMNWEHEYLEQKAKDTDEHYTDLQLLRVSKQLKMVISGAQTESDRVKNERAEQRIAKMQEIHSTKVKKLNMANRKVMIAIKDRLNENKKLDAQLKDLEANVQIREAIFKSRMDAMGPGGEDPTARKMKRVTMRRKLIDLAKAQTDEIEFLRMELDRLRQKTFPSFAGAARDRIRAQPDEMEEEY